MKLDRLLRPRTIAVVGGRDAAQVIEQCQRFGYTGKVWPVNPARESIAGVRCFRSIDELPGAPDAAFVGVNRERSPAVVELLRRAGAGGAVCYASGFAEAVHDGGKGRDLQLALVEAAGGMPLVGPNCYGMINYLDGALLWPNQHGGKRLDRGAGAQAARGVALVTQSSNIAINMTMQRRGLPVAYVVTAGNQAQLGLSEIASGLLEDGRVSALGLHIEGFDDARAFESMAMRARALGKPVVAIKIGRTAQARAAAVSHTASLTGSDDAADAFLRRLGVARVFDVPAFIETLKLLHVCGPLEGFDLSSMSCSGGEASLIADAVAAAGPRRISAAAGPRKMSAASKLQFRPLDDAGRRRIAAALGPLVTPANPLDYHTFVWGDMQSTLAGFAALVEGGFDLNLLVLDFPRNDRCSDAQWWPTLHAFREALARFGAKGAVVATLPENMPEQHAEALIADGIAPLCGIESGLVAVEAAAAIGAAWRRDPPAPLRAPVAALDTPMRTLDEDTAKELLARNGLRVPDGHRVATAGEAVTRAGELGFPVAVKALGIAHKTEANAVRLALACAEDVHQAAGELLVDSSSLLVERMTPPPVAELLVGITQDEQLGPVLTLGSGGVDAERLRDTVTLVLPAAGEEIEQAITSLAVWPLLEGFRGRAPGDIRAALDAVRAVAAFGVGCADTLGELDVNPLIVCAEGEGAFAADALVRMASIDDLEDRE